jgi:hypothetical protein
MANIGQNLNLKELNSHYGQSLIEMEYPNLDQRSTSGFKSIMEISQHKDQEMKEVSEASNAKLNLQSLSEVP